MIRFDMVQFSEISVDNFSSLLWQVNFNIVISSPKIFDYIFDYSIRQ